jgi:Flp pilus assembly protein TadD
MTSAAFLTAGSWHQAEAIARAGEQDSALILGLAIAAMGEADRAAPVLAEAAKLRPESEHPCVDLARLQPGLPRALVARQFRACLRLEPANDRLRLNFGAFLLDNDKPEEAETVLANGPDTAVCHHLMGLARAELTRFPDAIASFRRAVALDPDAAPSWSNLAMLLKVEGFHSEAVDAHDRAVALDPANPRLLVNRAVALLKCGRWQRAWQDYEARLEVTDCRTVDLARLVPSLGPDDRLTGRTVLAMHEDGYGDTLQFLRYLPLLAERGARVVAYVPVALERIMRLVPGVSEVVTDRVRIPQHDLVCPMFSLPRVFVTTVDTVPPVPPVMLDPALVRHWARHLPVGGLCAGLVWAGQARPSLPGFATLDRRRSAGLAAFGPLIDVPGVSFVSLQAGPAARQAGLRMADPMSDVRDFADTAAIIAGLDVVISVDTSVVHLAGLMGKPVFLLDRYDGCWRWLSDRIDSPWYPHLTIFRQIKPGDWTDPINRAAASLEALAMFRGFIPPGRRTREHALFA